MLNIVERNAATDAAYSPENISRQIDMELADGMAGRILTLIDASVQDARQSKAIKDLIKREVRASKFTVWNSFMDFCEYHDIKGGGSMGSAPL